MVLQDLSIAVGRSEFVSLLGPSGCGKTTLLRLIAGLLAPELGTISVGGRDLTRVAAHRRNIGVVFQNYALFPHLTVAENVAFGLKAQRVAKAEIDTRVREALSLVRMEDFADRSVLALSGGQQQRIAVARAIVVKPSLLLLDEPFSALDRKLRETMQIELRHLLRELGITSIFVTHDQDEALVMSDRIAVMNEGRHRASRQARAKSIRGRSTLYVMEFVGQSTRIAGRVVSASAGTVMVETPLRPRLGRGQLRAQHERGGRRPAGSDPARRRARMRSSTTSARSFSTSSISGRRPTSSSKRRRRPTAFWSSWRACRNRWRRAPTSRSAGGSRTPWCFRRHDAQSRSSPLRARGNEGTAHRASIPRPCSPRRASCS